MPSACTATAMARIETKDFGFHEMYPHLGFNGNLMWGDAPGQVIKRLINTIVLRP
jgi:hypothetical protein